MNADVASAAGDDGSAAHGVAATNKRVAADRAALDSASPSRLGGLVPEIWDVRGDYSKIQAALHKHFAGFNPDGRAPAHEMMGMV